MRAVGIVRQSNSRGKSEGLSPAEQRGKIEAYCAERRWEIVAVHEEVDISGGRSLDRRPGLGAAVGAVEAGQADVVVASEFTRLFRNIRVQEDVLQRVREAGGEVVAIHLGSLGGETSSQWMSTGFLGVISEGYRRQWSGIAAMVAGARRACGPGDLRAGGREPLSSPVPRVFLSMYGELGVSPCTQTND